MYEILYRAKAINRGYGYYSTAIRSTITNAVTTVTNWRSAGITV